MEYNKNLAIITGGNRGIGLAITKKLKEMGFFTAVIHKEDTSSVYSGIATSVDKSIDFEFLGDISNEENVKEFFERISAFGYDISVLVNNAGVASAKKFLDLEVQDFTEMLQTNLIGSFLMSKYFTNYCIEGSNAYIASNIINISSVSGLTGFSGHAHYCASKFALDGMSKVMAKELAKIGISVNNICPGPTQTDMWTKLDKEYKANGFMPEEANEDDYFGKLIIKRMGKPEDVAIGVEYLIRSNYSTGTNLVISGGNILR